MAHATPPQITSGATVRERERRLCAGVPLNSTPAAISNVGYPQKVATMVPVPALFGPDA